MGVDLQGGSEAHCNQEEVRSEMEEKMWDLSNLGSDCLASHLGQNPQQRSFYAACLSGAYLFVDMSKLTNLRRYLKDY